MTDKSKPDSNNKNVRVQRGDAGEVKQGDGGISKTRAGKEPPHREGNPKAAEKMPGVTTK